jgi:ADP-ribose pyrophosphatase YjhB (NUDIX family)
MPFFAVNVLVRTKPDRKFVVFRQVKYALPEMQLAPVGGFIEDGEAPLAAAKRELHEELGLRTSQWHALGSFVGSANRGGGRVHAFFADACEPSDARGGSMAGRKGGDAESQEIVRLTRSALLDALLNGRFGEVKWTATIALSLLTMSGRDTANSTRMREGRPGLRYAGARR